MRKIMKMATALLCTLVILVPTSVFGEDEGSGLTKPSSSPGSHDTEDDTTTTVYNYVEFGSYPQREVVSQASDSGVNGKTWASESDYIVDAALYNKLKALSEDQWSADGDATVDNNKYRRIRKSDATGTKSSESESTESATTSSPTEEDTVSMYYNWASSDTYHYFKYEPIKWRILQQNGNDYFLLSETVLDCQKLNPVLNGSLTWENSTLRSWLNGYDGSTNAYGTDYTGSGFLNTAFSAKEQARIVTTTIANKDNLSETIVTGNATSDKIFLLSDDEVITAAYGFSSSTAKEDTARQSTSSTYAKAMGAKSNDSGICYWWLRSAGSHSGLYELVRNSGSVYTGGQHANSKSRGVRPAMHIKITTFDGASLRRRVLVSDTTQVANDCTDIRLTFTFALPTGAAISTEQSCFYWTRDGADPTEQSTRVLMQKYVDNGDGSYTASLVLTNVPKTSFETTIKAKLHVEYSLSETTTTVDSDIGVRSVKQVIDALDANYTDPEGTYYTWGQYARYLKGDITTYSIA